MHELRIETTILAPVARCFDLARSVDAHVKSAEASGEQAVAGKTSGLLDLGDEVTWEARHFGVRQRLASQITAFERPRFFQDRMTRGAFKTLEHDHEFVETSDCQTIMVDVMRFRALGGPIGWLAERLVLGPYLGRFLKKRGEALKQIAESEQWKQFVPAG